MASTLSMAVGLLITSYFYDYCFAEGVCSNGDVRLDGPNEFEGRVEVCMGGMWGRWCNSGRRIGMDREARVVCRQLGYNDGIAVFSIHGVGNSTTSIDNVSCSDNQTINITECAHDIAVPNSMCNDIGVSCKDPSCSLLPVGIGSVRLVDNTTATEGRVEVCASGFRAGLCSQDFTPQAATVLCRELGLNSSNPGMSTYTDNIMYLKTVFEYNCNGNENVFNRCSPMVARSSCPLVRLNCSDVADVSKPTSTTTINSGSLDIVDQSSPVAAVVVLGVTCTVLFLLLTSSVIILVVLCKRKLNNSKVTLEEPGRISNNVYDQNSDVQRTVNNVLYRETDIPSPEKIPQSTNPSPPHVYDYAGLEDTRDGIPQPSLIAQHTLLHSTNATSDSGSHSYSKPTTPVSKSRNGGGMFVDALGYSELENYQSYSKLNDNQGDSLLDQGQSSPGYSQIADEHKYSKQSEVNSKGYSQLDVGAVTEQEGLSSSVLPYEIPVSPTSNDADASDHQVEVESHAYSTVSGEVCDTGYSKLHVFGNEEDCHSPMKSAQPYQDPISCVGHYETAELYSDL